MTTAELKAIRDGVPAERLTYATQQRARYQARDRRRLQLASGLPPVIRPEAGFLVRPAGAFSGVEAVLREAHAALATFDREAPPEGKNKKRFLVNVLYPERLSTDSATVRFALREDLLAPISAYLGVVPVLTSVGVYHSDTTEGVPTSSQLHHCDADDTTQVKVFVYCSDVTPETGPLTVLDAEATRQVQARTGYLYGKRLTDEQIQSAVPGVREHAILGPAGTVALVDTSRCFHYGSRVSPGSAARLAVILQYSTPYSFMLPQPFPEALPFRLLADATMTETQRLVLGASH